MNHRIVPWWIRQYEFLGNTEFKQPYIEYYKYVVAGASYRQPKQTSSVEFQHIVGKTAASMDDVDSLDAGPVNNKRLVGDLELTAFPPPIPMFDGRCLILDGSWFMLHVSWFMIKCFMARGSGAGHIAFLSWP